MTTQRSNYNGHQVIEHVNEKVIRDLMRALTHLDGLMTLSKKFTIELDGSYIEEMQYSCNRLLNAALSERERMSKGVDKHV